MAQRHLSALNQRLLQPEPSPLPRSHKQNKRLRLLFFLAVAAQLLHAGGLTPRAWAWLAAAPDQQGAQLWQAWQQAPPDLRAVYNQPDAHLPPPWPQPLLQALAASPVAFAVEDLTAQILNADLALHPYWVAHLPDLLAFDQLVEATLTTVLQPLGVVELLPSPESAVRSPESSRTTLDSGLRTADSGLRTADLVVRGEVWQIYLPVTGATLAQAQLAPYAHYQQLTPTLPPRHAYQLDAQRVSQAAAHGLGLPTLAAALAGLGLTLAADHWQTLHRWHSQGAALQLALYPVVRTACAEQLARIGQTPATQAVVGEVLAPTIARLHTDLASAAQVLRQAGWPVAAPATVASTAQPTASGALWLAGQLYALLGQHLPLPLPPPFADLQALWQQLPAAQQAVVHSQWAQLQEDVRALLDNLPFTPPPTPTDPAAWRPLLVAASAAQQNLQITYFSPGRNLLTQRLVQPYWLEEYRGVPYLRAYCHSAGRVLTFRLDRIQHIVN